jgi:hypothetical protein
VLTRSFQPILKIDADARYQRDYLTDLGTRELLIHPLLSTDLLAFVLVLRLLVLNQFVPIPLPFYEYERN